MDVNRKTTFEKIPAMFRDNFGLGRKVPASYGDQFYVLPTHINFVRDKLQDVGLA